MATAAHYPYFTGSTAKMDIIPLPDAVAKSRLNGCPRVRMAGANEPEELATWGILLTCCVFADHVSDNRAVWTLILANATTAQGIDYNNKRSVG
jgi:hypothetical protein